jgi:hypothetical protein
MCSSWALLNSCLRYEWHKVCQTKVVGSAQSNGELRTRPNRSEDCTCMPNTIASQAVHDPKAHLWPLARRPSERAHAMAQVHE